MKIHFHGAAGDVTGAALQLTTERASILVHRGLYQCKRPGQGMDRSHAAGRRRRVQVRAALAVVVSDGDRAAEVFSRIRTQLARPAVARQPCRVARIVAEVLPLVRPELRRHNISLQMSLAVDLPPVLADRVQFQRRGPDPWRCVPTSR